MPGSGMGSDVTRGEAPALIPSKGGRWLHFSAPIDGPTSCGGSASPTATSNA